MVDDRGEVGEPVLDHPRLRRHRRASRPCPHGQRPRSNRASPPGRAERPPRQRRSQAAAAIAAGFAEVRDADRPRAPRRPASSDATGAARGSAEGPARLRRTRLGGCSGTRAPRSARACTDFAREDALAAVVYVHDADLAGAAATQLEERGVAQCRLMLLERGHIAGEERSPLLFGRTGSIEVCARKTARVGGRRRFTPPAALRRFPTPENGEIGHRRDRFARLHASSAKADAAVIPFHVLVGDFPHPNPQLPGCA